MGPSSKSYKLQRVKSTLVCHLGGSPSIPLRKLLQAKACLLCARQSFLTPRPRNCRRSVPQQGSVHGLSDLQLCSWQRKPKKANLVLLALLVAYQKQLQVLPSEPIFKLHEDLHPVRSLYSGPSCVYGPLTHIFTEVCENPSSFWVPPQRNCSSNSIHVQTRVERTFVNLELGGLCLSHLSRTLHIDQLVGFLVNHGFIAGSSKDASKLVGNLNKCL